MKSLRKNPFEAIDSLNLGMDSAISVSIADLDSYFGDFDRTVLGRYEHRYCVDGSPEAYLFCDHYQKMVVIEVFRSVRLCQAKLDSPIILNFRRWIDEVYEIEEKRARFDFKCSRPMMVAPDTFVLYLPKNFPHQEARSTNAT